MNRPSAHARHWALLVTLILLAWALRVGCVQTVPPGWRDDELVHMHALTGQVLAGHPTFYFVGASGHEPLYHTLQAGVLRSMGTDPLSAHWLTVVSGTLGVPLAYVLSRRLFDRSVALLTAAPLTFSFWSLMYSRVAMRQQMLVPLALATLYLVWSAAEDRARRARSLAAGAALAAALYTYTASRMLPVLLIAFGLYLALVQREWFHRWWRPLLVTLCVAGLLTLPMWVAILQGKSTEATQGIGADARIAELAVPLQELQAGNPRPLLQSIGTTLGMFHATGDPEWLYNIAGRPVFDWLGGLLFWAGVLLCLYHWRRPSHFFLLLWLGCGLLPTVLSVPAASLSHSILIQPLAYLLPAQALAQAYRWFAATPLRPGRQSGPLFSLARHSGLHQWSGRWLPRLLAAIVLLYLLTNAVRDLHDYFVTWPRQDIVRFLYRADYRQAARFLDEHPEITDAAIGSTLQGPWDRLALADDLRRQDIRVRLFNPEWSLLLPARPTPSAGDGGTSALMVTTFPSLDGALAGLLEGPPLWRNGGLELYRPPQALPSPANRPASPALFANGLELIGALWPEEQPIPGHAATLWLVWHVARPLDLPPLPIIASPPPPGVYSGPRLAVFTHLLAADGTFLVGDDALWVDPLTLVPGDRFLQIHRLALPPEAPAGPYTLEVGLYDPLTQERWAVLDAVGQPVADHLLLPATESGP